MILPNAEFGAEGQIATSNGRMYVLNAGEWKQVQGIVDARFKAVQPEDVRDKLLALRQMAGEL